MKGRAPPSVSLRPAAAADAARIEAIYAHYVEHSTCTMQLTPDGLATRRKWLRAHGPDHPVLVAESNGEVLGWAALSPYGERKGYRFTVEDSVYLRHDARGRGTGRLLLEALLREARRLGHHAVIGKISSDQEASLKLHRALGFREVARLREVGFKLGKWIDVVFMELLL